MDNEWEGIEEEGFSGEGIPSEDEETLLRTIEITKEVLSSPRNIRPDHVYYAIEGWQMLQGHLMEDHHASDLAGEIVELLEDVLRRRHVTFDEAQRWKEKVRMLARFLGLSRRREPDAWD